ncbi:DNA processing protein DprA [Cetobacterium sp. ZWU0022]|uniref:DNA processing protein DprA n=1 Tax=Cetobacterium sp. ZWU0022 TaxID=1340502 RepID=UPI000645E959|nr:DNA processing protein DprA [Cetobacterium sp. ZWU0022]
MYSKDDMILWSMIGSMIVDVGRLEVLAFSPEYLFKVFRRSSELGVNVFKESYKDVLEIINELKDGVEKEKIKNLFGDFKILRDLKNGIQKEKNLMEKENIKMCTYFCSDYPEKLRLCKTPPFVLYYKGKPLDNDFLTDSISIVGTRNPEDEKIIQFTEEIVRNLKQKLRYNISGLALGCDTIGHKITMEHEIKNIAILGQGLGTEIYPKENLELSKEILENEGTLVSELPPSIGVRGIYLLARNRLQAYLAEELLVLETGNKGGTITTIKAAFLEKRKVYIRNIKKNQTMFTLKNISKLTFISCYSDMEIIKILTAKPATLFTFKFS